MAFDLHFPSRACSRSVEFDPPSTAPVACARNFAQAHGREHAARREAVGAGESVHSAGEPVKIVRHSRSYSQRCSHRLAEADADEGAAPNGALPSSIDTPADLGTLLNGSHATPHTALAARFAGDATRAARHSSPRTARRQAGRSERAKRRSAAPVLRRHSPAGPAAPRPARALSGTRIGSRMPAVRQARRRSNTDPTCISAVAPLPAAAWMSEMPAGNSRSTAHSASSSERRTRHPRRPPSQQSAAASLRSQYPKPRHVCVVALPSRLRQKFHNPHLVEPAKPQPAPVDVVPAQPVPPPAVAPPPIEIPPGDTGATRRFGCGCQAASDGAKTYVPADSLRAPWIPSTCRRQPAASSTLLEIPAAPPWILRFGSSPPCTPDRGEVAFAVQLKAMPPAEDPAQRESLVKSSRSEEPRRIPAPATPLEAPVPGDRNRNRKAPVPFTRSGARSARMPRGNVDRRMSPSDHMRTLPPFLLRAR